MEELVEIAVKGIAAFGVLANMYRPVLLRVAYRRIGCMDDAEDVVQEALGDALQGLSSYDPNAGEFQDWLVGYVRKQCEALRRKRDSVSLVELKEATAAVMDDPLDLMMRHETEQNIRRALCGLPKAQREAFELHAEGVSHQEIARRMGITRNAVRGKLKRARAALQRELNSMD